MTTETKKISYTPGPWKVAGDPQSPEIEGGDKLTLAFVNTSYSISDAEAQANAQLIAAAPELLEGLKFLFEEIDAGNIVRNITDDAKSDWSQRMLSLTQRLRKAQDAIAKAEGQ
jgi:hypothetical protein